MPQLISYLLPLSSTGSKDPEGSQSRGLFFNALLKLSNQQLLELAKSYSTDRKSVKVVVKNNRIESIELENKVVCKLSNLKEANVDLYASIKPKKSSDPFFKCVSIGRVDRRLTPMDSKIHNEGSISDVEKLNLQYKVMEKVLERDVPSKLSDLVTMFRGENRDTLRGIYNRIIGKNGLIRPECVMDLKSRSPTPELNRLLDNAGYSKFNPLRLMISSDTREITVPKKEERTQQELQKEDTHEELDLQPLIQPVTILPRRSSRSRPLTPQLVPYPQLKPLKKKGFSPTGRKGATVAISGADARGNKDTNLDNSKGTVCARIKEDENQNEDQVDDDDPVDSSSRRKKRRRFSNRKLSDDYSSSSTSSLSMSVHRSDKSSPLSSYSESDEEVIEEKTLLRHANSKEGLDDNDDASIRQLILKFQDTYRQYYKMYDALRNGSVQVPMQETNEKVKNLIKLQNNLQQWKHKLERILQ
ncbi:hypothetical protein FOA43_003802 [Brettanomyces nanus]|uniref:Uncharacterized protein n=1 Tax=Eeniella nana TaxID=13502 RepID=A0A875S669_EENNA|nr:uncharacterized protein FOA43_003802 [Brettanomyces nanus]QPG76413.1 hypothetical protein FOA43_003802 [Brettanomyces nanus]